MRVRVFALFLVLATLWGGTGSAAPRYAYPPAPRSNQVDDYHGVKVADPYRPLENPDAPATRAWIQAENKLTFGFLDRVPERQAIRKRLTELWNFERFGIPFKQGGRYFFTHNDGLQNQAVVLTADDLSAKPRVLLDPNTLSKDGTVALSGWAISHDGRTMAYGLSSAGSDWQEWHVRDVATARDLPDRIQWVKFSGASWTKDGLGFYYSRFDEPTEKTKLSGANYFQKLYYHKLGTPQAQDVLVYHRPDDKELGFGGEVSDDGRYLVIEVSRGTEHKNLLFYADLKGDGKVVELISRWDAEYSFIDNDGPVFWLKTNLDAPRGKVIAVDLRHPDAKDWKTVVPEAAETLQGASVVGGRLIASYLKDAHSQVKVFDLEGRLVREVPLPGIGTVGGFSGKRQDAETFFSYASFTTPTTIYRYDAVSGQATVFRRPHVRFDPSRYETKQVFYHSKDGTRIPMFITHRKGIRLDGHNPTVLYGYGGFNIPMEPSFSVTHLTWMELGGVYAMANLRGGGEYGEAWHRAGMKLQKQNVFDDFIAAAEWLIAHKYTSTPKLAITGRSNGGLLVGAVLTQRPDLFGAAIPGVGVMDMLRFHKFTIGWAWTSDYGSSENPEEFRALYAYSPLHHIRPGRKYPATLVVTADHDDRVVPAHSFKFAAALQAAQAGAAPVLIRIESKAGHGAGKPTAKIIESISDELGFLVKVLGMAR